MKIGLYHSEPVLSSQPLQHVSLENKPGSILLWEIHGAVETQLMEHLAMSYVFLRGVEGKEISSHQSIITIFCSPLCDFTSTDTAATTLKRVELCVAAVGHPILAKETDL